MDLPEDDVNEEQEDDDVPAPTVSFPFGRTHLPELEAKLYSFPSTVLTRVYDEENLSQVPAMMEVACEYNNQE